MATEFSASGKSYSTRFFTNRANAAEKSQQTGNYHQ
jgi:hypothetical protein